MTRPTIAITMGDPAGIGPEVIMKALAQPEVHAICNPLVIGDANRSAQSRQDRRRAARSRCVERREGGEFRLEELCSAST